jgi:uncharacterized membrane protein YgdD (TMEM256/DUF423 family)
MNKLNKKVLVISSLLGAITIGIGAFGAHGLKEWVAPEALSTFETGVRYQMFHVIALLILGLAGRIPDTTVKWVSRFFLGGILLFSGSIYLLVLKDHLHLDVNWLGPVTPLGGLLFIAGWLRLGYGIYHLK